MRLSGKVVVGVVVLAVVVVSSIPIVIGIGSSRGPGADFEAPGPRIVALSPAIATTVAEMGLGDRIVGRHAYDAFTARSVAVIGDNTGVDYEALARSRPTHVLTQWGVRGPPERLVKVAERHGWVMQDFALLTLEDVSAMVEACERLDESRAPGAARARLEASWARDERDLSRAGRVLLLWSCSPPAAMGPGSFHYQVLERLGGTPALTTGSAYVQMDAEDVLRLSPDGIVLVMARDPGTEPGARDRGALEARLGVLARLDVPAIRGWRVALIDEPTALLPGSSLAEFAGELRGVLREWSGE